MNTHQVLQALWDEGQKKMDGQLNDWLFEFITNVDNGRYDVRDDIVRDLKAN